MHSESKETQRSRQGMARPDRPANLSGKGKKRSAPGIGHVRKKGMLQKTERVDN